MIELVARQVWGSMLWLMRRPGIRRMQRRSIEVLPRRFRARAWANFRAQEAWAREHGLFIVRLLVAMVLLSLAFNLAWGVVNELMIRGWIPVKPIDQIGI